MAAVLLTQVRRALADLADPVKAPQMQRYMKSELPYHGVATPLMRRACHGLFRELTFETASEWKDAVLELWNGARFREERYAAIELTGVKQAKPFQTPSALSLYETLVTTGAWWDFVDSIATGRLGFLLREYPQPMRARMIAWSRSENLWKRRSAILSQLGFKKETDFAFMQELIEPSLSSKEFFLQKAIGWALRQYARTSPAAVRRYVRENEARLAALSKREALKHL